MGDLTSTGPLQKLKLNLTSVSWFPTANRKPRRGAERSGWRSAPPRRLEDTIMTTEQKIIRARVGTLRVVDRGNVSERDHWANPGRRHQQPNPRVGATDLSHVLLQVLERAQRRRMRRKKCFRYHFQARMVGCQMIDARRKAA